MEALCVHATSKPPFDVIMAHVRAAVTSTTSERCGLRSSDPAKINAFVRCGAGTRKAG
jgi:hypothetical protein